MIRSFAAWPSRVSTLVFFILHACALAVFCTGFLLTRVELPDRSLPPESILEHPMSPAPVHKTVWMIIDALRWDFVSNTSTHDQEGILPIMTVLQDTCAAAGGLPTFIDIGSSFSAAAVTEDNLIDQLHAKHKRLAFVGDDTWMQLFPTQFNKALPYASFEVHDLHTVDDGVWQHLLPSIQQPEEWDVLIGHYLGVDHVGHTFDVHTQHMRAKLLQMNQHVARVIEKLLDMAEPGGLHEHTMLLVFGDHGQTLTGDHGGGAPEEVDTAIFALHMGAYFQFRQGRLQQQAAQSSAEQAMPQVDFAPTMAALLGVAPPFGSIGKLFQGLWDVGHSLDRNTSRASYVQHLRSNARQVHTYLNKYAAHPHASMPAAALAKLNQLYQSAVTSSSEPEILDPDTVRIRRIDRYLVAAAQFAREQWTQFNMPFMVLGILLLTSSLLLQAASLMAHLPLWPWTSQPQCLWQSLLPAGLMMLSLLHALGLFSTSFILCEGQMVCFLVATMALLLLYSAVSAGMYTSQPELNIHAEGRMPPAFCHTMRGLTMGRAPPQDALPTADSPAYKATQNGSEEHFKHPCDKSLRWSRSCTEAVIWSVALLTCNALLGSTGLVTRTGHDAMHKAGTAKDHAGTDIHGIASQHGTALHRLLGVQAFHASVHWVSDGLQQTQALIVPAMCVLSFPLVLLGDMANSKSSTHKKVTRTMLTAGGVECLVWCAYISVAMLWVAQGHGFSHLSVSACLSLLLQSTPSLVSNRLHALYKQPVVSMLIIHPLEILLPALCFHLTVLALIAQSVHSMTSNFTKQHPYHSNTHVWVAILTAPTLLVLGSEAALASMLALIECVCTRHLFLYLHNALLQGSCQNTGTSARHRQYAANWGAAAEGSAWALISMQLFFCTGHFCEFAGLQYSAGFVGMTSFSWYASGALLALNTFGPQIIVTVAMCWVDHTIRPSTLQQHVCAVYLWMRTLNAWVATCSVALQRRHLMVWALFAPKFVFELCFLFVADLTMLLFVQ